MKHTSLNQRMMITRKTPLLAFILCISSNIYAQRIAVSTNLVEIASLSPSVGIDVATGFHSTISFNTSFAPWKISKQFYNKHISLDLEYKYWFQQALYAHYISINSIASSYHIKLCKKELKGQLIGLGLGYGYSFVINKHFNIIPHIAFGVGILSDSMKSKTEINPIITNIGINLQYIIR